MVYSHSASHEEKNIEKLIYWWLWLKLECYEKCSNENQDKNKNCPSENKVKKRMNLSQKI